MLDSQTSLLSSVMPTYKRFPIEMKKGKGSYVWDADGTKYLDFTSGIATCNLGHVPDSVKEAVSEQLENLWHCSNLYHIPSQEKLAHLLTEKTCFDQVFFCNSGAEANEAAIKLARRYANKIKGIKDPTIVTFTHSFHGRTLGTLTATAQKKIQDGFSPLMPGFTYLPYNDLDALSYLAHNNHCAAVLLELVQGEGGVIPADQEWVNELHQICKDNDILFMVDEVQSGVGRTGTLYAYEQYGIEPDVLTSAKGLGSGFPIGAMLAKSAAAKGFEPGSHGSTFGGNPLATTAGVATLETFDKEDILSKSIENGNYLSEQLSELKDKYKKLIISVRGKGLLLGLETAIPAADVVTKMREHQVLILTAGEKVARILPPLTTNKEEIDTFIQTMDLVLSQL
ncbi:acetylornithine transaminase [Terrilactibacillus sp. BCM23-1]|uniref:Acetylornithine aminotransferase n=1 Tax=Terrilactibacillus tamarindi TaxID=2599694 RepID=A0A6N8CP95_9BACI|nr:acetylornithine transaminase [Terrilactibacillus tamarindi]MTT31942.1 acetylornithine transaminase [Terrilactibacillus tamarindi]